MTVHDDSLIDYSDPRASARLERNWIEIPPSRALQEKHGAYPFSFTEAIEEAHSRMQPDVYYFPTNPGSNTALQGSTDFVIEDEYNESCSNFPRYVFLIYSGVAEDRNLLTSENASEIDLTPAQKTRDELERILDRLFAVAEDEFFESGMESAFTNGLDDLLDQFPEVIWVSLRRRLFAPDVNVETVGEMLRWAGRIEEQRSFSARMDLLIMGLSHSSPIVRDDAAIGLAHLGDPSVIPQLRDAIKKEKVPELREDLEQLVQSLEI